MTTAAPAARTPVRRQATGRPAWKAAVVLIGLALSAPVVVLVARALRAGPDLPDDTAAMALTTALLLLGVSVGTAVLGTGLAWLVAAHDFRGRTLLSWMLVLPLAVPAYILGFVFLSTFDFAGPVQTVMRDLMGADAGPLPVRSLGGAVVVLSLTLYPYVYLLVRAGLAECSATAFEAARTLGASRRRTFWTVVLPTIRPSLAAGLGLVMMETLTDFATVQYFSVRTVSVGVYLEWKARYDLDAAAQAVMLVLLFAVGLLVGERVLRGRARYAQRGAGRRGVPRRRLTGARAAGAATIGFGVVTVGFVLPVIRLTTWAVADVGSRGWSPDPRFGEVVGNTVGVAVIAGLACVTLALVVSHTLRLGGGRVVASAAQLTTFGYAVPGAVLGIGVLSVLVLVDDVLGGLGVDTGATLVVTGSVLGVVVAYVVRFTAPAYQATDASFSRIQPSVSASALTLGAGPLRLLTRVHLPQVRVGVAVAFALVVIDAVKELPLALLLRPFGFETLSIWTYRLARENLWGPAALPALSIVAVATVAVVVLDRRTTVASTGGVR